MTPAERLRVERGATHLHALGPRPVGELLIDLAEQLGALREMEGLLAAYGRLSVEVVRAVGADRYPACRACLVPQDIMRGGR